MLLRMQSWPLIERLQRYLPSGRLPISHNPASFARLLETHRQGLLPSLEVFDWLWLDFSVVPSDPMRFERALVAFRARGDHKTCLRAWRLFGLSQAFCDPACVGVDAHGRMVQTIRARPLAWSDDGLDGVGFVFQKIRWSCVRFGGGFGFLACLIRSGVGVKRWLFKAAAMSLGKSKWCIVVA